MKGYKSSENRLIKLFKEGREKWKQRALSKQKKLRSMDIKVRDISLSREKWKEKAQQLEASLKEKEAQIEELKKKITNREINQKKIP